MGGSRKGELSSPWKKEGSTATSENQGKHSIQFVKKIGKKKGKAFLTEG